MDAELWEAEPALVRQYLTPPGERLRLAEIGGATFGDQSARPVLNRDGFGLHTFMCGQSGSGKTYSLGVILEQILLHTEMQVVVLDPNSDYTKLDVIKDSFVRNRDRSLDMTEGEFKEICEAYQSKVVKILRPEPSPDEPSTGRCHLRLRFSDLHEAELAALLRLDPIQNRDEYGALLSVSKELEPPYSLEDCRNHLNGRFTGIPSKIRGRAVPMRSGVAGRAGWRCGGPAVC